jgi:hypothetical protein
MRRKWNPLVGQALLPVPLDLGKLKRTGKSACPTKNETRFRIGNSGSHNSFFLKTSPGALKIKPAPFTKIVKGAAPSLHKLR